MSTPTLTSRRLMLSLPLVLGLALLACALLLRPSAGSPAADAAASPAAAGDDGAVGAVSAQASLPPATRRQAGRAARLGAAQLLPSAPVITLPTLPSPPPSSSPGTGAPPAPPVPSTAPPSPGPAAPPAAGPAASPSCAAFPTGKAIVLSLAAQELSACQNGTAIIDTPVTTGRPELPTPPGITSVLSKSSPWVMRSPWPRSSKFWYPPSRVDWVLWFREGGYGIHDAPWRDAYGPGTDQQGSHGCVNVPHAAMQQLFRWADVGTPVQVT